MGVVTVSSSVSRSPLGLSARFSSSAQSGLRRPTILAFKTDKTQNSALAAPHDIIPLPIETSEEHKKRVRRSAKRVNRVVKAVCTDNVSTPSTLAEVDYNEAAAKLENLYNRSSDMTTISDVEHTKSLVKRGHSFRKKVSEGEQKVEKNTKKNVVGNGEKKYRRLQLDKRIELSKSGVAGSVKRRKEATSEDQRIERLVREYSVSTDLVSLDWKKIKIPPVLPSSEHTWLFKLMQPMKAISKVKEHLISSLEREPTESEIVEAINMTMLEVRKHMEVGRAARNKLIKHNLRLVLFVINKYFQELGNGPRFHDLCQAGVKGLITAIDRFEPNRKFRLSTYGLFWIRHAITRSITVYSFARVSFGLESVRIDIQKAKSELESQLNRMATEEEIIKKVGISPERYREVMRAAKPVYSLNAKHPTTQEELIGAIADVDGAGGDNGRQPALLRLALDDVLDSLKPKESLVIRQRYGLDGKGERTLGEIAGNLNISREMVRKYEVKALMKLKHPARVDYLRRYLL